MAVRPSAFGVLVVTLLKMLTSTRNSVTSRAILPGITSMGIKKEIQDTITNNQFPAQRLAQMEQTFDSHLAKEINNLADHTSNAWVSFDKQDAENTARLTSSMSDVEEDVRVQSPQLVAMSKAWKLT